MKNRKKVVSAYKRRKSIYNRTKKSIDKGRTNQTPVQKRTVNLAIYRRLTKNKFKPEYTQKVLKTGMGLKKYNQDKRYFKKDNEK